jgi:hypothetical protein
MHADRNRRYRARTRRVTDHSPVYEVQSRVLAGFVVSKSLTVPASMRKPFGGHEQCHNCGRSASAFLRVCALRPHRPHTQRRRLSGKSGDQPP